MFRNYLTIAFRHLIANKLYSVINIGGLAIGMACCGLIFLYVQHEVSYDRFHAKSDRTYRVMRATLGEDGDWAYRPGCSGQLAGALAAECPEVETSVRVAMIAEADWWVTVGGKIHHVQTGRRPYMVDPEFFDVFDFPLLRGDRRTALRDPYSVVLTEEIARMFFKYISRRGAKRKKSRILGVMRDFHLQSLHEEIDPLAVRYNPSGFSNIAVRVRSGNLPEVMSFLDQTWKRFLPDLPLEYSFVDEMVDAFYREDQQVGKLLGVFTVLAVLVACLGLFGLAAFAVEQRTKEIGVRKVLGADVSTILMLFSGEFIKMVLLANLDSPEAEAFFGRIKLR